jgi:cellulose synthase/poly-beta-1,6-N-acetylglucosamine synthase-like glycosyltransferase
MLKTVSIIIPVKEVNDYIAESLGEINKLDYGLKKVEVIVLPDSPSRIKGKFKFKLKVIPTGHIYPGEKRDIGIKKSAGEIVAFIDDDVFPKAGWLKTAVNIFGSDKNIGAACGPAVTPENDSFLRKVSGFIYSSFLGGGGYRYRYMPEKARFVEDYPSCNLLVRRDVLEKVGGFNTEFWPGEDTVLCLKIVRDLKLKIAYDPDIFVYHHRREFFSGHIKQVKSYAMHRGYFVKRFPETSLKAGYFVPSAFALYLVSFSYPLIFCHKWLSVWSMPLELYVLLLFADSIKTAGPAYAAPTMAGILLTHIYYGLYFLKGLFSTKLNEEKGEKK